MLNICLYFMMNVFNDEINTLLVKLFHNDAMVQAFLKYNCLLGGTQLPKLLVPQHIA